MTTIDTTAIAAKINARKEAEAAVAAARQHADEVLDLAVSEAIRHGAHGREFFLRIYSQLGHILSENPADPSAAPAATTAPAVTLGVRPMTDDEARRWERTTIINFGKHQGSLVKDVPLQYLQWIDGENEFSRALHRYLAAPNVTREADRSPDFSEWNSPRMDDA